MPGYAALRMAVVAVVLSSARADTYSETLAAGQVYRVAFRGYSCVKYAVSTSGVGNDVRVILMPRISYDTYAANRFLGAY